MTASIPTNSTPAPRSRRFRWLVCALVLTAGASAAVAGLEEVRGVPRNALRDYFYSPGHPRGPSDTSGTVVVIDLEAGGGWFRLWRSAARAIQDITGAAVVVLKYDRADEASIMGHRPDAVVLAGWLRRAPADSKLEGLAGFLRTTQVPVLGICGGHLCMGKAFGAPVVNNGREE